MLMEHEYIFWEYIEDYGIFNEKGDLVSFQDDAPEEVKKSWEEYRKRAEVWKAEGIK